MAGMSTPSDFTTVTVDAMPSGLDADLSLNLIFVDGQTNGTLTVIDAQTGAIVASAIPLGATTGPHGVAVNSTTHTAFVADQGNNSISVIAKNGQGAWVVTSTIQLAPGAQPHGVAVNPVTNMIYVANQGTNTVSIINGATLKEVTGSPVGVGKNPHGIEVDTALNRIFVACRKSKAHQVSVLDGATNACIPNTLVVGASPTGVGVNSTTHIVYVSNNGGNTVSVIDGQSLTLLATVPVGAGPDRFAIDEVNNIAYVCNNLANTVMAINSANQVSGQLTVGNTNPSAPTEMAWIGPLNLLFVALQNDNEVVAVSPASFQKISAAAA
jgi:YVTN family beta-propeller protein